MNEDYLYSKNEFKRYIKISGKDFYHESEIYEYKQNKFYTSINEFKQHLITEATVKSEDLLSRDALTVKEVQLLVRRYNNGENLIEANNTEAFEPKRIIDPQQGYEFLMKQWKTPMGKERVNNPFGSDEEQILDDFDHFEFVGIYDDMKYGMRQGFPLYEVVAKSGRTFMYYYNFVKVNITQL